MTLRRCGVLGDPVDHSLSPVLHRAGYAATGLDWSYDAHRVPAGRLATFLAGLDEAWAGVSVTMPLKREALAAAAGASDLARRAGAANTLVRRDGGWWAENTDVPGATEALRERAGRPFRSAVILGGGATATSTGLALADLGAETLTLAVRDEARAGETLTALRGHPARPRVRVVPLAGSEPFTGDVLVSTLPARAQTPALVARSRAVPVVFDVLYEPWPTAIAADVLHSGRTLVGGLDLLVHQALLQFELFTGSPAPGEAMRAAGEAALAERRRP